MFFTRHKTNLVEPGDLTQRLEDLGWQADVRATPTYFLYGTASR